MRHLAIVHQYIQGFAWQSTASAVFLPTIPVLNLCPRFFISCSMHTTTCISITPGRHHTLCVLQGPHCWQQRPRLTVQITLCASCRAPPHGRTAGGTARRARRSAVQAQGRKGSMLKSGQGMEVQATGTCSGASKAQALEATCTCSVASEAQA